jgi:hypothetical protein
MLYCGNCNISDACGAGGTPNVCAPAMAMVCGATPCPAGMQSIGNITTNITYGTCNSGGCSPGEVDTICIASTIASQVMQGCSLNCPAGYSLLNTLVSCTCPAPPSFYNLCAPN